MNTSSSSNRGSQSATTKHRTLHGICRQNEKWVARIRVPGKHFRLWLGSYPTAAMAAAAYDVAALALKGRDAMLNFPELVGSYQVPESQEPHLIKSAAKEATKLIKLLKEDDYKEQGDDDGEAHENNEFIDEEAIFYMPNLVKHMAAGMMVSPPREPTTDESSPGNSSGCDMHLWSN